MQEPAISAVVPSEVVALHLEILMTMLDECIARGMAHALLEVRERGADIAYLHAATSPTVSREETVAALAAASEKTIHAYVFHEYVWRVTLLDGRGSNTRPYKAWLRQRFDGAVAAAAYDLALTLAYAPHPVGMADDGATGGIGRGTDARGKSDAGEARHAPEKMYIMDPSPDEAEGDGNRWTA